MDPKDQYIKQRKEEITTTIREMVYNSGVKVQKIAELVGMTPQGLSRIMHGAASPSFEKLLAIEWVLNVKLIQLNK